MTKLGIAATTAALAGTLWFASQWWETGLAEEIGTPVLSPGGCYRVERLKPFWILPNLLHPQKDANGIASPEWFVLWENPGFYRLYDQRTGDFLGQSEVYDFEHASGPMSWGSTTYPWVSSGTIYIAPNTPDCIGDRPTNP